ncbi:hypothetical protein KSS87_017788 [Heliosperma pusillum]|nr:hypothetical protein KSS87_017788 [Heliosperma pusillum]
MLPNSIASEPKSVKTLPYANTPTKHTTTTTTALLHFFFSFDLICFVLVSPTKLAPPSSLSSTTFLSLSSECQMTPSSISSCSIPAPEAVQILVSSLGDESPLVREASMASLVDIAALNPLLVLDCCAAVSRGGRRRFGNIAGLFQVMAFAVKALKGQEVDPSYMLKLAKIATAELISSKELNAEWQRAASNLLVAIGSHFPNLMLEEISIHVTGTSTALPAVVQILADFASADALQFTPRLKDVLSRVLPILGSVRDIHRPIFANGNVQSLSSPCAVHEVFAFRCWCQAVSQYITEFPSREVLDADVMSFLNSAFELFLKLWATSRDVKVRMSTVEALGQMVGLINRQELKTALPRIIPIMLDLYKKDQEIAYVATCSLHHLLTASLQSESGPPLLDFEDLTVILSTLLPVVVINNDTKEQSKFSVGLKTYNEIQHCFLTIGVVYPEDLFVFLLNKCRLKEEALTFGALSVLKHLLPRLCEAWHHKMPLLVDVVKMLLNEHNLGVRKALSELIVVMASHCYLVGLSGELFVEYLVRHCSLPDQEKDQLESSKETPMFSSSYRTLSSRREVRIGMVSVMELRSTCEKGLLLLTITIPEMEHILWPFLLKMIVPRDYTGAIATVCRCISELCRNKLSSNSIMLSECTARNDIPNSEVLFARLIILLHDPLGRDRRATYILSVLNILAPLFPKNVSLFWQDEIPKMKAYISDTEDLKQDPSCRETWDDMIVSFLAETLDVSQDADWIIILGETFAKQYDLYTSDDEHSALLHRCLGVLLQKVVDKVYVRDKIDLMYKQADIAVPTNRLGLAKGMGLVSHVFAVAVAASHLDIILEKLKEILDNVGQSIFQRLLSYFSDRSRVENSDDIHAALALMYGYAAKYAPSSVIEARIDALVGTNMLSRLLHVHQPVARQAVITAIDLLGKAVIRAGENGTPFPLKRRDQLLDYILTLMGHDNDDGFINSSVEFLQTEALALSACTTLVSVEPRLTLETRNHVMKAVLGFFALPSEPSDVVNLLIDNLINLLCAILLTSGEDGKSRTEQLLHILRQLDLYVSSPIDHQRRRACQAVHEMLVKFPAFVLPSREALAIGDRVIIYLPRCADSDAEVRKFSIQIFDLFFSISLSLPRPANANSGTDLETCYGALASLEDVIAILRSDASIDPSEVFSRVVSSLCTLLTKDELVAALHGCTNAICDKVKQSAEGSIHAVIEFVTRRKNELNESDISRTTHSLLSALGHVAEKYLRQETLSAISALAENTSSNLVFNEVLATAGRDIVTKDISRLRGGWPMQDAFCAFSQHNVLSFSFLEHVTSVLNHTPIISGISEKGDYSSHGATNHSDKEILQAAIFALTAFFRGGGKIGKKAVEQSYSSVLASLLLQLGTCHALASSGQPEPLRYATF